MNHTTATRRQALTRTQLRELQSELVRESARFRAEDPRSHAFAAALRRLEEGTYGTCLTCGGDIPFARLSVMPETAYCVGCCGTRG